MCIRDRISITSQNHGFAVDPDTVPDDVEITLVNLNDNTVEGIAQHLLQSSLTELQRRFSA